MPMLAVKVALGRGQSVIGLPSTVGEGPLEDLIGHLEGMMKSYQVGRDCGSATHASSHRAQSLPVRDDRVQSLDSSSFGADTKLTDSHKNLSLFSKMQCILPIYELIVLNLLCFFSLNSFLHLSLFFVILFDPSSKSCSIS